MRECFFSRVDLYLGDSESLKNWGIVPFLRGLSPWDRNLKSQGQETFNTPKSEYTKSLMEAAYIN